jgi:DNA-binding LacI/PurR family transcriptional regulator
MTVVSHMLEQIGRTAAELAIRMAEGGAWDDGPRSTRIPAELVVRSSTGPAPVRN